MKCVHPTDVVHGAWEYHGHKLVNASGYCQSCNQSLHYCAVAQMLVVPEAVKEPLDKKAYWWLLLKAQERGDV